MKTSVIFLLPFCASLLQAAPVGVDGSLGSEWTGFAPRTVLYNPAAPAGNFQAPTNESNAIAYDVYLRADNEYVYGLLITKPELGGTPVANFANLYFDTDPFYANGSDVGFEIVNNNVFIPGVPGNYDGTPYITFALGNSPVALEFALAISFFTKDPLHLALPQDTDGGLVLRLSQSFGYSVAGGPSYGVDRLGAVVIPEPAAWILAIPALVALLRRKRT